MQEQLWIFEPSILFSKTTMIPNKNAKINENINTFTRLIVIAAIVYVALTRINFFTFFLIFSLVACLLLKYQTYKTPVTIIECNDGLCQKIENFAKENFAKENRETETESRETVNLKTENPEPLNTNCDQDLAFLDKKYKTFRKILDTNDMQHIKLSMVEKIENAYSRKSMERMNNDVVPDFIDGRDSFTNSMRKDLLVARPL